MDQSSVIGASLVIAYVVFIITKGELPCYLSILGIASATVCPASLQQPGCGGTSTTSATGGTGIGIHLPGGGGSGGVNIGINLPPPGTINFPGGGGGVDIGGL